MIARRLSLVVASLHGAVGLQAYRRPSTVYSARGAGGHYILIIPQDNVVIVHRVNTNIQAQSVSGKEFGELVKRILDAGEHVEHGGTTMITQFFLRELNP